MPSARIGKPVGTGPEISPKARRMKASDDDFPTTIAPDKGPVSLTYGHVLRHAIGAIARANALTHHRDGRPIPVTDAGAMKLQEKTFGKFVDWGKRHPDQLDHAKAILHHQAAASYRQLGRQAAHVAMGGGHTYNSRSDTRVGTINVHTAATDARGIAADIEPHLRRGQAAGVADYGLA